MEQLGLITARVESGLLTAHLTMARDTFGPMARVDTGLLKAHNFIGPNGPKIYFGLLTACPIWANMGLRQFWPILAHEVFGSTLAQSRF